MSLPALVEVEHADWPSLQRMCEALGLNPKGRSAVVRMRVLDHVRRRTRPEAWRPRPEHEAPLLTRLGFPDLAERLWESTIRLDAPAPWVGLGHAELAAGRLTEAAKAFSRAAQMGDPVADLHRAEALAADGDCEGAARACDRYLGSSPGHVRALAMKAGFLARAGFVDEGTKVLELAAESHPEIPALARTLGTARIRAGHPETATDAFQEAIRRDPHDVDARINRGAALLLAGRTREAVRVLREALELDPRRAEALNNLGVAYLQAGHARSAGANLERAAKHLEHPRIVLNLGKVRKEAGDASGAIRAYAQVLRLRPKDVEALAGQKRLGPAASEREPAKTSARKPSSGPRAGKPRASRPASPRKDRRR